MLPLDVRPTRAAGRAYIDVGHAGVVWNTHRPQGFTAAPMVPYNVPIKVAHHTGRLSALVTASRLMLTSHEVGLVVQQRFLRTSWPDIELAAALPAGVPKDQNTG